MFKKISFCLSKFNVLINQRRFLGIGKKFYKFASVKKLDNYNYEVNLDERKLKTPKGKNFIVDNEILAQLVAHEWNSQEKTINLNEMHLTSLVYTYLDNPLNLDKKQFILNFLDQLNSDTILYFINEPEDLYNEQKNKWYPLINWFENYYNVKIPITTDLIQNLEIEKLTLDNLTRYLNSFNEKSLISLHFILENLKSVILTLALVNKRITVKEAVELSRLELSYQTKRWGTVEWAHDLDSKILEVRVSSGLLCFLL